MKRKLARRLPLLRKWVRQFDVLEGKYAKLKEQRDDLKIELKEVKTQLEAVERERHERRARLHKMETQLAVPPEPLRLRVHGTSDEATFLSYGSELASAIKQVIGAEGFQFDSFLSILDFGCGCGRVLRFFEDRPASCKLFGTDIDPEAIRWCEDHLGSLAAFSTNGDRPPLAYADNTFDFIYGVSVFTHLPEDLQFLWLEELRQITKPGGVLLLSVHGDQMFRKVPKDSRQELAERGFCHVNCGLTSGLPDYYQTSFHSRDYIRGHWSRFFSVRTIVPMGAQDAVVLFASEPSTAPITKVETTSRDSHRTADI